MALVSVVMPAYNSSRYILKSVETVLAQKFTDWELIIIDDHSSDDTSALVQPYLEKHPNIRYFLLEKNSGVAVARNEGVKRAGGKYIAFLDSDDLWHPEKLEAQLTHLEQTDADLVYTAARCIDDQGKMLDKYFKVPSKVDYSALLLGNDIICSSVLVKAELMRRFPMQRSDLHEDYICWLSLLKAGCKAFGLQEPLVFYRHTANSKSRSKLKSAKMTYGVYKYMGVPFIKRMICFAAYALHGFRRYFG